MEDDPYSTVWLEAKPVSPSKTKSPHPNSKHSKFFSKAGQKRLRKIWDDHNLDEEVLFTGIAEPSDSFMREKVSDYVQHYLFRRARRLSMGGKTSKSQPAIYVGMKGKQKFREYEDFINNINKERDKIRMLHESERISELLITGRIKIAPEEFQDIFKDPVFKVNRLLESVKKLGHSKIKVDVLPFEIPTMKIKILDDNFKLKDRSKIDEKKYADFNPPRSSTRLNLRGNDTVASISVNSTFNIAELDAVSASSGFNEFSNSNLRDSETPYNKISTLRESSSARMFESQNNTADKSFLVEFPPSDDERSRSYSVISELSDQELSACAEKQFATKGITGDLEISAEFSYEHAPLEIARDLNDCNLMYKLASDIIQMFQRQEVVGDEWMEYFSLTYFK